MTRSVSYSLVCAFICAIACGSNDSSEGNSGGTSGSDSGTRPSNASQGGVGGTSLLSIDIAPGSAGLGSGLAGAGNVCESIKLDANSLPPRVVFVQDLSSSMQGQWQPLDDAMVSIAKEFGDRLQLGMVPFSSVYLDHAEEINTRYNAGGAANQAWFADFFAQNDDDCNVSEQSVILPNPGNAPRVIAAYDAIIESQMVGGTPTYLAMQKAADVLVTAGPRDGSAAYAILVTDGEPNCGSPTSNLIADVTSKIAELAAAGVSTYVVGYRYDGEALDTWAAAGKTGTYYDADDSADLSAAISGILTNLVPCEYTLSGSVKDTKFVRVTIDGKDRRFGNAPNGWALSSDRRTVILTGDACTELRARGTHSIAVVVECEEVIVLL